MIVVLVTSAYIKHNDTFIIVTTIVRFAILKIAHFILGCCPTFNISEAYASIIAVQ